MKINVVFTVDQTVVEKAKVWGRMTDFTYERDGEIADLVFAFVTNSMINSIEKCEEVK